MDEPARAEELDEVADPAADGVGDPEPAVFAGPDIDPDRAACADPDASTDRAGPTGPAVPDAAVRPVEAVERDTYTVPGAPGDDDRSAGSKAPDDWFPGPGAPEDDRPPGLGALDDDPGPAPGAPSADDCDVAPEARDEDGFPGPAGPDDDRLVADRPPEAADRRTGGDPGPGFLAPVSAPVPVPRADVLPAEADGRPVAGPRGAAGSSASAGRTARSSSGPPGDAEGRAEPGRATPWMRPTGADGRTAWPSSPPRDGFCQEARRERNRSPSLTPIEDRATVTDGGATRRHPPSQPPSPSTPPPAPPDAAPPAGPAGTADTSSRTPPPRVSLSRGGAAGP
ncbi:MULTISPECIES: hypothetical protein [unclassified Streptomyces]|uniref:hypothetical protein n=1 Tax=unclassified Streptomyces TaxID=2593676 RepID=UPI000851B9B8|nr:MULTISPECIES: hypothetical protein [unclassified Streptomyces]